MQSLFTLINTSYFKTSRGHVIHEGDVVTPYHGRAKHVRYLIVSIHEKQVFAQEIGFSHFYSPLAVFDNYINEKEL